MTCDTLIRTDPDGRKHYKSKKVYNTLDDAIAAAKKQNASDKQITKVVSYKCNYCQKYHIGRNGKNLTEKEKAKYKKETNSFPKILGKIDLDTLKPTSPIKVVGWVDLSKIKY